MLELYCIIVVVLITYFDYGLENKPMRWLRFRLNYKPFSCAWCLSLWIGIIISLITCNFLFITLPITVKYFSDER